MITPVRNHPTCAQNATLEACGFRAMEICKKNHTARKTQAGRRIVSRRRKQISAGSRTNVMRAAGLQMKNAPKTPLIAPLAPIRGAEEYGSMESKSILVGLSFGLGPSHVCYPLAQESDHERILAFEFVRVNGKKLRDPVGHHLLELVARYRFEAAKQLGAHEAGCGEISFLRGGRSEIGEIHHEIARELDHD